MRKSFLLLATLLAAFLTTNVVSMKADDLHSDPHVYVDVYQAETNNGTRILYGLNPVVGDDGITYRPVDVGAGVAFANKNLGAQDSLHAGSYFYWGGITPFGTEGFTSVGTGMYYTDVSGMTTTTSNTATQYALPAAADAATQIMGSEWRMPTYADLYNLVNSTILTKSDLSVGYQYQNNIDKSQTILIPASGYYTSGTTLKNPTSEYFWGSTLGSLQTTRCNSRPAVFYTGNSSYGSSTYLAYYALPIRAVYVPPFEVCTLTVVAKTGTTTNATYYFICQVGQQVTVTAHNKPATANSVFVKWTDANGDLSTDPTYTLTVSDAKTITATFGTDASAKVLTTAVEGGGTVQGGGRYKTGQSTLLMASPLKGWVFDHWKEDGSSDNPHAISMDANYTYTAVFTTAQPLTSNPARVQVSSKGYKAGNYEIMYYLPTDVNGYRPVDMGCGLAWANKNVGATDSTQAGDYFYWGGITPMEKCDNTIPYSGKQLAATEVLAPENDAATQNMGECWRMPTSDEWTNLWKTAYCTWTASSSNYIGVNKNKPENQILLPPAGYKSTAGSDIITNATSNRYYWASNLSAWDANFSKCKAYYAYPPSSVANGQLCYIGLPVRAVYQPPFETCTLKVTVKGNSGTNSSTYYYYYICEVGQRITLSASPDPTPTVTYAFTKWTNDAASSVILSTNSVYEFTITENTNLTATFETKTSGFNVINAYADPRNSGLVYGGGRHLTGTESQLFAEANGGYRFDHWKDNSNTNPVRDITIEGNQTYEAVFVPMDEQHVSSAQKYENVWYERTNNGTFVEYDGGDAPAFETCTLTVVVYSGSSAQSPTYNYICEKGQILTLSAFSKSASFGFTHWTDANLNVISREATCDFVVAKNETINVYYNSTFTNKCTLTASTRIDNWDQPAIGGNFEGQGIYEKGTYTKLVAIPNPNFEFLYWDDDHSLTDPVRFVTIEETEKNYVAVYRMTYDIASVKSPEKYVNVYKTGEYKGTTIAYILPQSADATGGYRAVDLGTGIAWANKNVGAVDSTQIGDYYAYGGTTAMNTCTTTPYTPSSGVLAANFVLPLEDDAAYVNMPNNENGYWRMPTKEELTALNSECTKTSVDATYYIFSSAVTGQSFYLPKGGYKKTTNSSDVTLNNWYYRTSTMNTYNKTYTSCTSDSWIPVSMSTITCYFGLPVRAVYVPKLETCTLTINVKYGTSSTSIYTYKYICEVGQKLTVSAFYESPASVDASTYTVDKWTSSNGSFVSVDPTVEFLALYDETYTVTFKDAFASKTTITAAAEPIVAGIYEGTGDYEDGTTAKLIAHPAPHYKFLYWEDNHTLTNPERIITVNGSRKYVGVFAVDYDLTQVKSEQRYVTVFENATFTSTKIAYHVPSMVNGYRPIDMGTGIAWANRNVGANDSTDGGDLFYWGATEPMNECSDAVVYTGSGKLGTGFVLPLDADAANVHMGEDEYGYWRMPTNAEYGLLMNDTYTSSTATRASSEPPYLFTSKAFPNNSLLLPYTGGKITSGLSDMSEDKYRNGRYWTSTWNSGVNTNLKSVTAYYMYEHPSVKGTSTKPAWHGCAIRGVYQPKCETCTLTVKAGTYKTQYICEIGQKITVTAYPKDNTKKVIQWKDDATKVIVSNDATVEFLALSNVSYTVTFGNSFTEKCIVSTAVATNSTNMGVVNGAGAYEKGTKAMIEAVPNRYYQFIKWSDNCTDNPRVETITGNVTFTAEFAADPSQVESHAVETNIYQQGNNAQTILYKLEPITWNGYTYNPIDMGYGVAWADRNINADSPEADGGYFYFGGTSPKVAFRYYNNTTYYYSSVSSINNGATLYDYNSNVDAAYKLIGMHWRIPSKEEWEALISNTDKVAEQSVFVSRSNKMNQMVLPAAGLYAPTENADAVLSNTDKAYYWSGTMAAKNASKNYYYQSRIYSYYGGEVTSDAYCCYGMPIRAIYQPPFTIKKLTIHVMKKGDNNTETIDHDYVFYCQQHQAVTVTANSLKGNIFEKWSDNNTDEIRTFVVSEDMEYNASFVEGSASSFRIIFKNANGETIGQQFVDYGVTPSYEGEDPTMTSTAEYDFTFREWSPTFYPADQNQDYTAVYDSIRRKYAITFLNDNDTILQNTLWEYGVTPAYNGTPVKTSTEQYDYVFAGWNTTLVPVIEEASYKATYTPVLRKYTITYRDSVEDGGRIIQSSEWEYGSSSKYTGIAAPTLEGPKYIYKFHCWTDGNSSFAWNYAGGGIVTGEKTYYAVYDKTLRSYTVTFLNYDGSQLQSSTLDYGAQPVCDMPTKPETSHSDFIFTGWLSSQDSQVYTTIPTVTGQVTYTAQFQEQEVATHKVTFLWEDGTQIDQQTLKEGRMPVYAGATPLEKQGYAFAGWNPALAVVGTTDVVYTATFLPTYTITANTANLGRVVMTAEGYEPQVNSGTFKQGTVLTLTAKPALGNTFLGWSDGVQENTRTFTVTKNENFTANFQGTQNVTVEFETGILDFPSEYLNDFAIKGVNEDCEIRLAFNTGLKTNTTNYSSNLITDISKTYIQPTGDEKVAITGASVSVTYAGEYWRYAKMIATAYGADGRTYNITIYTNEEENSATMDDCLFGYVGGSYKYYTYEGSWIYRDNLHMLHNPYNVLQGWNASYPFCYNQASHLLKWWELNGGSSLYEVRHVQLEIIPIEGKPGIIPSGIYPINSTRKPGTVFVGKLPTSNTDYQGQSGNFYKTGCGSFFHYEIECGTVEDPKYIDYRNLRRYDYILRSGYVEVINSNEKYVIHVHAYADAHHTHPEYGVVDFYINGTGIDSDNPADFMPANITIAAKTTTDTPLTDAVTATVGTSTTPIAQGVHSQLLGDELHLVADKNYYVFSHWLVNGEQVSTSPTYDYTVNGSNTEIVAVFAPDTRNYYTISTTLTGGTGSVNLVSGLKNYTTSGLFPEGSEVTLTVTPGLHIKFVRWEDGNTDNPRTITVSGNQTYTAVLAEDIVTKDIYQDGTYAGGINIGYHLDPVTVDGITYTPVDMGNGLALADRNIGAATPQDAGRYFYWGDIIGQDPAEGTPIFSQENYYKDIKKMTQYSSVLPLDYDAAHVILGDNWRMPTLYDISHLYNYQHSQPYYDGYGQWKITGQYHNYGIDTTGSQSTGFTYTYNNDPAHSIFVPAVYYYRPTKSSSQSTYFWISTCGKPSSNAYDCNGSYFSGSNWGGQTCYYGMPIRPMYAPNVGTTYTLTIKVKGTSYTYQYTCQAGQKITINPNAMTGYSFDKWLQSDGSTPVSDPLVVNSNTFVVNGNATYYASFKQGITQEYHITFVDEDGTTILEEKDVEAGQIPAFTSETPTKTKDVQYTYTFAGWNPALYAADKDQVYTATYSSTTRQYTITIANTTNGTLTVKNGTTTISSGDKVDYGTVLTVTATANDHCHFVAWTNDGAGSVAVNGDKTIGATFAVDAYTLTMDACGEGGTYTISYGTTTTEPKNTEDSFTIDYNTEISLAVSVTEGYEFVGWKRKGDLDETIETANPFVFTMTEDVEYQATFKSTVVSRTLTIHPIFGDYPGIIQVTDGEHTYCSSTESVEYPIYEGVEYTCTLIPEDKTNGWGWWLDYDGSILSSEQKQIIIPTDDVELYAGFGLQRVELDGTKNATEYQKYTDVFTLIHELVYLRTFKAKTWSTMWMPFDIDLGQQGLKGILYTLSRSAIEEQAPGIVDVALTFHRYDAGIIEAGEPCLFYTKQAVTNFVFHDVAMLTLTPDDVLVGTENAQVRFFGTTEKGKVGGKGTEALQKSYRYLSGNVLYYPALNQGVNMETFRGCFQIVNYNYWYGEGAASAPRMRIIVDDETVITEAETDNEMETRKYINDEGHLIIERNGVKYTANGAMIE